MKKFLKTNLFKVHPLVESTYVSSTNNLDDLELSMMRYGQITPVTVVMRRGIPRIIDGISRFRTACKNPDIFPKLEYRVIENSDSEILIQRILLNETKKRGILRFSQRQTYWIIFEHHVSEILKTIHLDFDSSPEVYLKQFASVDAIAGYLSGLFLATGSVNHPSSSSYHLEMSSDDEDFLTEIQRLLKQVKSLRFSFKLIARKGKYILYLKKSDQIADFLIFMGATEATLEYENVRVARDFSNSENRLQICENANMAKTIAAAKKQKQAILLIDRTVGLQHLNHPKLEKLCRLRMKHDSSSLEELASMMSSFYQKPISKSQLNHLFRGLMVLAKKLKGSSV